VTIDVLLNDVLLDVFERYVNRDRLGKAWQTLAHVCQRWRRLVFGQSRRLNLRLVGTASTSVRKTLKVWPDLPIVILIWFIDPTSDMDNVIAALEHNDRVYEVKIRGVQGLQVAKVLSAMEKPFPALTALTLQWYGGTVPVFPDSFSAPRLQTLCFDGIPFPALRKLLLLATDIGTLNVGDISRSVYVPPEELVTCLSALTRLKSLSFKFQSPPSRSDQQSRRPPPPTRAVLPSLTSLKFEGVSEYLDDLVARIDAPRLKYIYITLFDQPVFDTLRLIQFIERTPEFEAFKEARLLFYSDKVEVFLSHHDKSIMLEILITESGLQLSPLTQICSSFLLPLLTVEHLYILENRFVLFPWDDDDVKNTQWLEILLPFTAVKNLYLPAEFAPCIVPVLQELVGERVSEVLPALQNIFLQELGPVKKAIQRFVTARRLSGHPVTVHGWSP
jgi:hypothetical protein